MSKQQSEWSQAKQHATAAKDEAVEAGKHAAHAVSSSASSHNNNSREVVDDKLQHEGRRATAVWAGPGELDPAQQDKTSQQHHMSTLEEGSRAAQTTTKGVMDYVRSTVEDLSARLHITAANTSDKAAPQGTPRFEVVYRDRRQPELGLSMGPDYNPRAIEDAIDASRDGVKHAADVSAEGIKHAAHVSSDATQHAADATKQAAEHAKGLAVKARDSAAAGVHKVEEGVEAVAAQVDATRKWVGEKAQEAADAWVQEITPQNEEEALMEQGLIPSNTEDVLAHRGD